MQLNSTQVGSNDYATSSLCNAQITSPPVVVSSGGGGGNSGGSGGYCLTKWICSEWNTCANGIQTRTCSYPTNFCAPRDVKPVLSQTCTLTNSEKTTINNPTESIPNSPTITGGVTGTIGKFTGSLWGWAIIALIMVAIGFVIALLIKAIR